MIVSINKSQLKASQFARVNARAATATDFGRFIVFTVLQKNEQQFREALSGLSFIDLGDVMQQVEDNNVPIICSLGGGL